MNRTLLTAASLFFLSVVGSSAEFDHFITRDKDRLMEGDKEFRFISFNIPNLHYVEDDLGFDTQMPFRFPDAYEIEDALLTIQQMGGRVARTYTLSVAKKSEPNVPKHILGPGQFNEEAFRALDQVLALANKHQVRLIIPFVNNFQWWGGAEDYAAFRGKTKNEFWTDPQLIDDLQQTIRFVIERVNTVNGVPYKEDKSILAWETANESECPHSWTHEVAQYIKSLDSNHLVVDGFNTNVLREESITDPLIDIVQTHHYENNPQDMIDHIKTSVQKVDGRKPYMLGEFGFIGVEAVRAVLDTTIKEGLSGALIWSLRYHHKEGGFFWHSEPAGGDFFKAYHWPGFDSGDIFDERDLMALIRRKAYEINGQPVPPLRVPNPPPTLFANEVDAIRWQGSAGATGYDIERSESDFGPWITVAQNVSDADVQYYPLFNDRTVEIGKDYFYRIRARNEAGVSEPSPVYGPPRVNHLTLVDDLQNDAKIFYRKGKFRFAANEARRYKEDCHRLEGESGSFLIYRTPGEIHLGNVYTFAEEEGESIAFSVSLDGQEFQSLKPFVKNYNTGGAEYGYLKPIQYRLKNMPLDCRYLKLEWNGKAALSRIEIQYGN